MKKEPVKPNLLVELTKRKMEAQNSGKTAKASSKYKAQKNRNENNSNVGPAWGGRKGN